MKFGLKMVLGAALALGTASPALAVACDPLVPNPDAVDCEQIAGNILNNSNIATLNNALDAAGYAGPDLPWSSLEPTKNFFSISGGDILNFQSALLGVNFIAVHFGNAGTGDGNLTLVYQFNFLVPTTSVDLNRPGFSDAVYVGSNAVPEPATWAMMLLGFGATGFALRRRRASVLPQAA